MVTHKLLSIHKLTNNDITVISSVLRPFAIDTKYSTPVYVFSLTYKVHK